MPNEVNPENLIAAGIFTCVHRISDTRVRKVPRNNEANNIQAMRNEANIYTLLGPNDHIAICTSIGMTVDYVELAWAVHGTLEEYIKRHASCLTNDFRLQKAREVIEAVQYIHLRGVIHSDLCLRQYLLYEDLHARLSDFAASGYLKCDALGMENASHYMPRDPDLPNTVQSDIFALGSTLYELMTGEIPYYGKSDNEIQSLYEEAIFPCTNEILCGDIILNSWRRNFSSSDEVLTAFDNLLPSLGNNIKGPRQGNRF
jgi:serine/threonine protein kinase